MVIENWPTDLYSDNIDDELDRYYEQESDALSPAVGIFNALVLSGFVLVPFLLWILW